MGNRGPQPGTGGRPRKPLVDKIAEGHAKKYTQGSEPLPEPIELEGVEMPPPHEFLSDEQKNGQELVANEIYKSTWEWLRKFRCEQMVTQQSLEQYAVMAARWIQCEKAVSTFGFLAKHPTTGAPITSPYVSMGREYSKHANALWNQIYAVVRENSTMDCSTAWSPADDVMERLLTMRRGK